MLMASYKKAGGPRASKEDRLMYKELRDELKKPRRKR
jgi:hypothetical protein